jgi:hypothetical protein
MNPSALRPLFSSPFLSPLHTLQLSLLAIPDATSTTSPTPPSNTTELSSLSTPMKGEEEDRSEQLPQNIAKKEECPWKFKGLPNLRHLCPHIKAKEQEQAAPVAEPVAPVELPARHLATDQAVVSKAPLKSTSTWWSGSWHWVKSFVVSTPPTQCDEDSDGNHVETELDDDSDGTNRPLLTKQDLMQVLGTTHLINSNDDRVSIDSLVGKTIALYFSASWCPPCRRYAALDVYIYIYTYRYI